MDIMQRQTSFDSGEDLDGSDFDDDDDDQIYDCPEQDDTLQAGRLADVDGKEEEEDIYDLPYEARDAVVAEDDMEQNQQQQQHPGDRTNAENTGVAVVKIASRGIPEQSLSGGNVAQARGFFSNGGGAPVRSPATRMKPSLGITQRWPPQKIEEQDIGAGKSASLPPYSEKLQNIINKLSPIIGDGRSSSSWDRSNNACINDMTRDEGIARPDKDMSNVCPPKFDRSEKPPVKEYNNRVDAAKPTQRDGPTGNGQVLSDEAPLDYDIPRELMAGQQKLSRRTFDSTSNQIEEKTQSPASSESSFQTRFQNSKQESHGISETMPQPAGEGRSHRTAPLSSRGGVNYADIIVGPIANNRLNAHPGSGQVHKPNSGPISGLQYHMPMNNSEARLPQRTVIGSDSSEISRIHNQPRNCHGQQAFHIQERPHGRPQCNDIQENYDAPGSDNAPAIPPDRPNRGISRVPPRHLVAPQHSQEGIIPPQENYDVPRSNNAPAIPPDRPMRGKPGPPSSQHFGTHVGGHQRSNEPNDAPQENYDVPRSNNAPSLPPDRPMRGKPGPPTSPHFVTHVGGYHRSNEPNDAPQENYDVPRSNNAPALPPDRPMRGKPGPPSNQHFSTHVDGHQRNSEPNDIPQENYEVPTSGNAPALPPDRPMRGKPDPPSSQHFGTHVGGHQRNNQPSDVPQENYEFPTSGNAPALPPDRPMRGKPGPPSNQHFGTHVGGHQRNTEPNDIPQENYEVPTSGNAPALPPGRPMRGKPGLPYSQHFGTDVVGNQRNNQPSDVPQENYEVPSSGNAPALPSDRPMRGKPGPPSNQHFGTHVGGHQRNSEPNDASQENYEVPTSGNAPALPPDRPMRGKPGPPSNQHFGTHVGGHQRNTEPNDVPQENYEVPTSGNAPALPPGRPMRGKPGPPSNQHFSTQAGGHQRNSEPNDASQESYEVPDFEGFLTAPPSILEKGESDLNLHQPSGRMVCPPQNDSEDMNYEVPDSCNQAPVLPLEGPSKGTPAAPSFRNPPVAAKPGKAGRGWSLKNFVQPKKNPPTKPSKPAKGKLNVNEMENAGNAGNAGNDQKSSNANKENCELVHPKDEVQDNYEVMDQANLADTQNERCPPEGQEHRSANGISKRHVAPDDEMLNQVVSELTNPRLSDSRNQPVPRHERPRSIRQVPPRPPNSESPLLDLSELPTAAQRSPPPVLPTSPRQPPQRTIEQKSWFHGAIDRNVAASKLRSVQKDGAFLIRNSGSGAANNPKATAYSISIYYQGEIRHLRIEQKNDGFHLGSSEKHFDSVQDLVAYFQTVPIELLQGGRTKLTVTVPKF